MTEEEKERFENNLRLAMKAQSGDGDALDELCDELFPLILSVRSELSAQNIISAEYACSLGRDGVIASLKNFDVNKGDNFANYCRRYIKNAIKNEVKQITMTIRIPGEALSKRSICLKAKSDLEKMNGIEPSIDEIADYLKMSPKTVRRVMLLAGSCFVERLDREIDKDGGGTVIDFIGDEKSESPVETADASFKMEYATELMERVLKPRELDMVMKSFGIGEEDPWTIDRISNKYKISRQRVSQIINFSLAKIKRFAAQEGEGLDERRNK
jgi:RNA polymerase sigma factor (sigma-70 family)